jgi:thiopeptide-type bacteriocin biosynthesis protein
MNWLSLYIFYAEPWDQILVDLVKPLAESMQQQGKVEKFFFIRYWEKGPHLRLRFLVNAGFEQDVKAQLTEEVGKYLREKPSNYESEAYAEAALQYEWYPNNSLQWIAYEPEVARYGGPHALPVAESLFQCSSYTVLEVMAETQDWDYDAALGSAIQMHLAFVHAAGMSKLEAAEFFGWIFQSWLPMAVSQTLGDEEKEKALYAVVEVFDRQFEEQKSVLLPFVQAFWDSMDAPQEYEDDWVQAWIKGSKETVDQLQLLARNNQVAFFEQQTPVHDRFETPFDRIQFWSIYASFVHMVNNRVGVQNRDEGYLGYLICKAL